MKLLAVFLLVVLISVPTTNLTADEKAQIEAKIQRLQSRLDSVTAKESDSAEKARIKELKDYLQVFKVGGLTLGDSKTGHRCCCEEHGVYIGGRYVGDVHSLGEGRPRFDKAGFIRAVLNVLKEAGVVAPDFHPEGEASAIEFIIHPSADSLLRVWGGGIKGNQLDYGSREEALAFGANTAKVEVSSAGTIVVVLLTNRDGSKELAIITKGRIIGMLSAD